MAKGDWPFFRKFELTHVGALTVNNPLTQSTSTYRGEEGARVSLGGLYRSCLKIRLGIGLVNDS